MSDERLNTTSREYQFGKVQGNYDTCDRLIDWLRSSPRKPPELAFTAGPERDLAEEIEMAFRSNSAPPPRSQST